MALFLPDSARIPDPRRRRRAAPASTPSVPGSTPGWGTNFGAPRSNPMQDLWGTAESRVYGSVNPLLDMLTRQQEAEEARARGMGEYWRGGIDKIIGSYREPIKKLYDEAISTQTGIEESVADRLNREGASQEGEFAKRLDLIDAPNAEATAQGTEDLYTGASGAGFASGMADVTALNAQGAAAREWLEKQGVLANQQATQELYSLLDDIYGRYGGQREEITAGIPAQIQQMYDTLYGQNQEQSRWESEFGLREREAIEAKEQNLRAARAADRRAALDERIAASRLMSQAAFKKWDAQFKAREAEKDRQLDREIAQIRAQTTMRGQDISLIKDTNNPPPKPPAPKDDWRTPGSAKRDRVRQSAWVAVVSPEGGWNADVLRRLRNNPNSPDAIINTAINSAMRSQGITNPNSPSAVAIRNDIRRKLSGRRYIDKNGVERIFRHERKK